MPKYCARTVSMQISFYCPFYSVVDSPASKFTIRNSRGFNASIFPVFEEIIYCFTLEFEKISWTLVMSFKNNIVKVTLTKYILIQLNLEYISIESNQKCENWIWIAWSDISSSVGFLSYFFFLIVMRLFRRSLSLMSMSWMNNHNTF